MLLTIQSAQLNCQHKKSEIIDRPNGRNAGIFMQFTSKAIVLTQSGLQNIFPGDCMLSFSQTPAYIASQEDSLEGFSNSFLVFGDDHLLKAAAEQYQVPHNTIIRDVDFGVINGLLNKIYIEHVLVPSMYKEQIDLLVRELLIHLGRAASKNKDLPFPKNRDLHLSLHQVRKDLYLDPLQYPTVNSMAEKMNICSGYFRNIYKELFGVTPKQDMLHARIEKSKSLLILTDAPVSFIAAQCGFEDENYFSRAFKTQVRLTPSAYRKQNSTLEGRS